MKGLPVTIRTVDIGADKPLDGMTPSELRHESILNPALGLRAIRWSLSEPSMFRRQLRALFRAAHHGPVKVMIPMLASQREIHQTLENIAIAKRQLTESGRPFGEVQLGAMIEVPAAALTLPVFLRHFDFVSIGTNDLIQYTLAIDRTDETVAHLYDPWHPAVLQLILSTISQARAAGKGVSVCGEMAGDPAFTELLLAMGLRSFSMHPTQIASIKQKVLRVHAPSGHLAARDHVQRRPRIHLQSVAGWGLSGSTCSRAGCAQRWLRISQRSSRLISSSSMASTRACMTATFDPSLR